MLLPEDLPGHRIYKTSPAVRGVAVRESVVVFDQIRSVECNTLTKNFVAL